MVHFLFKWLMVAGLAFYSPAENLHPIYVSVTEIEHNTADKTLEISCKIFTDDFEKTLRQTYKTQVDLLKPKDKAAMNNLVKDYVTKHMQLKVDTKPVVMEFLGYEQDEEGIISYYQVNQVLAVKQLDIVNNILFEYKQEQMNIIHVHVQGKRMSTKLLNPQDKTSFSF